MRVCLWWSAEARAFVEYLSSKTLHVDVWDGDSLLLLGSLAIPLWRLLRQGSPVAKLAHEVRLHYLSYPAPLPAASIPLRFSCSHRCCVRVCCSTRWARLWVWRVTTAV